MAEMERVLRSSIMLSCATLNHKNISRERAFMTCYVRYEPAIALPKFDRICISPIQNAYLFIYGGAQDEP